MENTQKFWIILTAFICLFLGSKISNVEHRKELNSKIDEAYMLGKRHTSADFLMMINDHSKDTNRVTEINFINCLFCDSTDLKIDTITYYITPKNIITK